MLKSNMNFRQKVLAVVKKIPHGRVASYGQIALYAGKPRGAREVGWILHSTEMQPQVQIPWWRVINNAGRISIKGSYSNTPDLQRKLLTAEGVEVAKNFDIDIEKYRWRSTNY